MNVIEESLWLQIQKPLGEELHAKHIFLELSRKFFIGLDRLGFRHILIESSNEDHSSLSMQFRGVQVVIKELVVSGGIQKTYIDLICREPAGHHIFNSIGGEIAQKIADRGEESDSIEVITAILAKWKHFWGNYTQGVMTLEEQIGLFGELFFIRYWLIPRYGERVILAWQGPSGGRHDFVFGDNSIEVKTSSSSNGHIHRINGVDQLDNPQVGSLYLFSLWIRQTEQSDHSLISVIDSLRDLLDQDADIRSAFESLLSSSGYSEIQRAEYEKRKYEILEAAFFLVDQHFPRITQNSFSPALPNQIEQLVYSLNLNSYLDKSLCSSVEAFLALDI